ncbi:MAG: hypothetical protein ABSE48_22420 [Verrucomicrobiota bacterium]|jgi:hypothetical protein
MAISKIPGGAAGQNLSAILEISRASAYPLAHSVAYLGTSDGLVTGNPIVTNHRKAILCEFWTHEVHETGFFNSPSSA